MGINDKIRIVGLLVVMMVTSLFPVSRIWGQGDVQLTQFREMPTLYNPAATCSTDYLKIRGAGRLQWIGIDNAPKSFIVTAESPLQIGKKRIGLGVNAMSESIGLFDNLDINLQASYKLKALGGQVSIGVQGGFFTQKFEGTKVELPDGDDYHESGDEGIPQQDLAGNVFDLGVGVRYDHPKFYVGISALHLMSPTVSLNLEGTEATDLKQYESELPRMLYFMAGGNIPVKNTLIEIQPSLLVRSDLSMWGAEANVTALYNKLFRFGVGYRWKDAVSIMAGVEIKNFYLGYSYDYPMSAISKASSGSHELVAGYQLKLDFSGKNRNKHRSIRLM